jgi:hypothetical protein
MPQSQHSRPTNWLFGERVDFFFHQIKASPASFLADAVCHGSKLARRSFALILIFLLYKNCGPNLTATRLAHIMQCVYQTIHRGRYRYLLSCILASKSPRDAPCNSVFFFDCGGLPLGIYSTVGCEAGTSALSNVT